MNDLEIVFSLHNVLTYKGLACFVKCLVAGNNVKHGILGCKRPPFAL